MYVDTRRFMQNHGICWKMNSRGYIEMPMAPLDNERTDDCITYCPQLHEDQCGIKSVYEYVLRVTRLRVKERHSSVGAKAVVAWYFLLATPFSATIAIG